MQQHKVDCFPSKTEDNHSLQEEYIETDLVLAAFSFLRRLREHSERINPRHAPVTSPLEVRIIQRGSGPR